MLIEGKVIVRFDDEIFEGLAKAKSKKYLIKDCCKFSFPEGFLVCFLCFVTYF